MSKFKPLLFMLLAVAAFFAAAGTKGSPARASGDPKLLIAPSSAAVAGGGKADLKIGTLIREAGNYIGNYEIKVSPYFFENEKGKLTIAAPDDSLSKLTNGIAVSFTGKAVTDGSGKTRRIDGKVTPSSLDRGSVTLWFLASNKKVTFSTSYSLEGE